MGPAAFEAAGHLYHTKQRDTMKLNRPVKGPRNGTSVSIGEEADPDLSVQHGVEDELGLDQTAERGAFGLLGHK